MLGGYKSACVTWVLCPIHTLARIPWPFEFSVNEEKRYLFHDL